MKQLLTWLRKRTPSFICAVIGHGHLSTVEPYQTIWTYKNYKGLTVEDLTKTDNVSEVSVRGKLKCKRCGQISIGNVKYKNYC